VHNRENGKRSMEQVAVMQNVFYNRKISKIFDLKGSLRGRFASQMQQGQTSMHQNINKQFSNHVVVDDGASFHGRDAIKTSFGRGSKGTGPMESDSVHSSSSNSLVDEPVDELEGSIANRVTSMNNQALTKPVDNRKLGPQSSVSHEHMSTLLDGDFLEFTSGRPMPLTDRAKAVFQMSILNDTLFLNYIYVLDYSILVGFDEEKKELVVGIIDFMRQYDILKQMERVGKSLPMVVGSEAPTIIQPPLYKARFTNAMERYFMTAPSKWTTI
jgi:Phosphatidylinositol-4-phosphate 5-Kinase